VSGSVIQLLCKPTIGPSSWRGPIHPAAIVARKVGWARRLRIFRHKDVFQAYYDDQRGWVYEQRDGLLLCRNVYTFLPPRNIASAAC